MQPDELRLPTQDEFDDGGDISPALPPLAWEFTEPADLLNPDWGRNPATVSTSMYVTANLIGYQAEKFEGDVDLTLDGETFPFIFSNNCLTADLTGLTVGFHTIHLHAGSAIGIADLYPGDILVWMNTNHVAIFSHWENKDQLIAKTVESWGANGPGLNTRYLDDDPSGAIEGRRWVREGEIGITVFHSCP